MTPLFIKIIIIYFSIKLARNFCSQRQADKSVSSIVDSAFQPKTEFAFVE